ncbi:MAG: hypothetical protein U0R80_01880 [Nocardioidaceae bacterium]
MKRIMPAVTVVAVALLLVVGADYLAVATTGRSLILGRLNTTERTTVVKNTGDGPAMRFKVSGTADAPFAVSSGGRVDRLNADKLDGLDSTELAPVALGVVDSSGDLLHGRGVSAVSMDATSKHYVITLDSISYLSDRFTTVVTTTCQGVVARATSSSGDLLVTLQDADQLPAQCQFGFVTYAL